MKIPKATFGWIELCLLGVSIIVIFLFGIAALATALMFHNWRAFVIVILLAIGWGWKFQPMIGSFLHELKLHDERIRREHRV